jgi:uncharacterized protein
MKFLVYKDQKGEWRWRLKADDGRIIADSAAGYNNHEACLGDVKLIIETGTAEIIYPDLKPTALAPTIPAASGGHGTGDGI